MSYRVVLSPLARDDLREHGDWYRIRDRGLARRFNRDVLAVLDTIADSPLRWAIWRSAGHRRTMLAVFPYTVIYRVDGATVTVLGILHQQQDASRRFPEDP